MKSAKSKTAEQILAHQDLSTRTVACPEWDAEVIISVLTVADKAAWSALAKDNPPAGLLTARLIIAAARNPDGSRLFKPEDAEKLAGKSAVVIERLAQEILDLNGMLQKNLGEAVKN